MKQQAGICIFLLAALSLTQATQRLKVTKQVYFDVKIGDVEAGRLIIGLFGETAPKTVDNFFTLATTGLDGKTYKGTKFHRVIKKFMLQGGDLDKGDGSGSISIYGKYFDDEKFEVKHTAAGLLSMANAGPNTNGCQFFITTVETPWLDGLHVVFGKVISGQEIIQKIELLETDTDDHPKQDVVIADCGELALNVPFIVSDQPYELWEWLWGASIPIGFSFMVMFFFHWVINQLDKHLEATEKLKEE